MNSLPRKNYALNRVSHLTKSSNAIATTSYYGQSIANQAQLSSSIFHRLTIPQLSQIFYDLSQFDGSCTTEIKSFGSWHFLHLTWWLFKRQQLLHKANQLHSSSWVWLSHSPALSTRTYLLSRFLLSLSTIFQIGRTHSKNHIFRC